MPDELTPGDGQDALAHFKSALEKRDPDRIMELFAEEAEYRFDPFEPALTGANAIRDHWNRFVAERIHVDFDAERVWVVGRTVLASWHGAYTRRETAERIRVRGFSTIELDEADHIARLRDWSASRDVGTDGTARPDADR